MATIKAITLPSGDRYLRIPFDADPEKDEEWLEGECRKMLSTPSKFRLEILMDDSHVEGALWQREWIDDHRVFHLPEEIDMRVIALDPSVSDPLKKKIKDKPPDPTGIIVASRAVLEDGNPHYYVEQDWTGVYSPRRWAQIVNVGYAKLTGMGRLVNSIVYETNQGGEMVMETLKSYRDDDDRAYPPYVGVHTVLGKRAAAEPAAALSEQGQLHFVGRHRAMEDELCTWDSTIPGVKSPGRIDALVKAVKAMGGGEQMEIRKGGQAEGLHRGYGRGKFGLR